MQTISELRAKAAELRRIADKVEAAADALSELGETSKNGTAVASHIVAAEMGPTADLKNLSGIDAMERVLTEAGTALNKAEIFERLKRRGKAIGEATVESYLSRDKHRFKSCGRGYWTVHAAAKIRQEGPSLKLVDGK